MQPVRSVSTERTGCTYMNLDICTKQNHKLGEIRDYIIGGEYHRLKAFDVKCWYDNIC